MLLYNAEAAGVGRAGVDRSTCSGGGQPSVPAPGSDDHSRAHRMVALLIDGLRYGARS